MSKKSRTQKARQRQSAREHEEERAAQQRAELARDRERFGEVLFSVSYDANDRVIANASVLYLPQDRSHIAVAVAAAGLLIMLVCMIIGAAQTVGVLIFGLVLAAAASIVAGRWNDIQLGAILRTNLAGPANDQRRHVAVTPEQIVVEGPGDASLSRALSDVSKVRRNASGTLVLFKDRHEVAYFPLANLGERRTEKLVDFLVEHKGGKRKDK